MPWCDVLNVTIALRLDFAAGMAVDTGSQDEDAQG
jgi:hypothetical protein